MKRILTFLNKEFHGVNEAALLLGGFAFLSQLLGLVRDRSLAHYIGAGPTLDVYYAAFRIPDFLYISIASLASITVLMPFLVEKLNGTPEGVFEAKRFMNTIFSAYMLFMVVISSILALCMPYLVSYIAPGFSESQHEMLVTMSRIMLLSPICIGLSNLIGTITQLFKNFLVFSLSPIFYNLGIICGVVYLYPRFGLYGLGFGVVIGALLHLCIQIPVVARHGFLPRPRIHIPWSEVYSVIKLSLPRTIALSANSFAFIILIAMASQIGEGSISLFTFAYNLQSVPVGIIGISYSVAAFPILVKSFSMKDMDNFMGHVISAGRQIIFWSLPVLALLIVLRAQIVRVILGSGTFSWADTRLTAASVALFLVSLVSQGLVLLFVRGYYASGNTRKPLFVNVFSSIMVVVFGYVLLSLFDAYPRFLEMLESILRVRGVSGTRVLALPLAYTMGSLLNFFLIWGLFKKDFFHTITRELWITFYQSAIGALVMGMTAYLSLGILDDIFTLRTFQGVFLQGFISGILGISFGVFVLFMMKNKELALVLSSLKKKFWKGRVVAPEQKGL
ncbi:MAG: murein biosynthesis integral membrane protein MurJ [Candidatus Pacebacteria bacterium]|nr:murein biosynthesis integral membrane protein MurJ [Candidatus Paceibacterota bacterium]